MSPHNIRVLGAANLSRVTDELSASGLASERATSLATAGACQVVLAENVPANLSALAAHLATGAGVAVDEPPGGGGVRTLALGGTWHALHTFIGRLSQVPEAREFANALGEATTRSSAPPPPLKIRDLTLDWGTRTYVMGIVNATPDSFSGDGTLAAAPSAAAAVELAVAQAERFVAEGAHILDVGGESTRPQAAPVDAQTEAARVVPVIRRLRQRTEAPISVDTYKAEVAQAALDAGADLINDVWGLRMDPEMAPLAAARQVPVVLMHNRSRPHESALAGPLGGHYVGVTYDNLMADVLRELRGLVERALEAGIARERIIVDPGIGFGKTVAQNLRLLDGLDEFRVLGLPLLLATSRKSFIGHTLDLPPEARLEGTAATVAVGIVRGADIVRVHDVRAMARVARMTDALVRPRAR